MYSARLKTFDLVYPDFKGTCIEFINGIMQVCWHFKKGLHWNCQGYFWKNSVKCRKQYKAPTNSIRKLTICIDNAGPLRGPALYQFISNICWEFYNLLNLHHNSLKKWKTKCNPVFSINVWYWILTLNKNWAY